MTSNTCRHSLILALLTITFLGCAAEPQGLFFFNTIDPRDNLFQQNFSQAISLLDQHGQISCVLTSNSSQANNNSVKQTCIIRTFWLPNQTKTSVSPSSTNVNLEYLIETAGSFAYYRGAGFAKIKNTHSLSGMELDLQSSQIRLYQQTSGFKPSFIKTNLTGRSKLDYAPQQTQNLIEQFENNIRDLTK
ncbi:MAG: hypothetical protein GY869_20690 [Planctomycetes bacterium]|nr:hypothetical protein [Planctomycetota bacterium]